MEQFIGLIIFFVAWIVISSIKKAAKKQQAAMQQMQKNSPQSNPVNHPASTADEINKLIEMFTQGEISTQKNINVAETQEYGNDSSIESIESSIEAGGFEVAAPAYSSIDNYVPYSSEISGFTSEDNLQSVLSQPTKIDNVINRTKNWPNPVLSDFDLKKAVIYSAILEPKYI